MRAIAVDKRNVAELSIELAKVCDGKDVGETLCALLLTLFATVHSAGLNCGEVVEKLGATVHADFEPHLKGGDKNGYSH